VPVAYLNSIYEQLGVIWFDAHADLNLPHTSPSGNFHGMPLGVLLEGDESWPYSGTVEYSQIHYLGLRDIDPYEQEVIEKHDITCQRKLDTGLLLEELKVHNNLYIHFDVDVLDPTEFPHSFYQVSDGWTVESCMEALNQLQANFNIVGGSITEVTASSLTQLEPIRPILDWFRDQFI
jgi:arginase